MSNPVIDAFFLGRAFAEVLSEKLEDAYTHTVSELGKFDAEQREHLRQLSKKYRLVLNNRAEVQPQLLQQLQLLVVQVISQITIITLVLSPLLGIYKKCSTNSEQKLLV